MAWHQCYEKILPYIFSVETPDGWGSGFFFAYNETKSTAAFATAAHVIAGAEDWKQPIKMRQHTTRKEIFLTDEQRFIYLDRKRDSASILIKSDAFELPADVLPMLEPGKFKKIGVEVGWAGYPVIAHPHLCFFTGPLSAVLEDDDSYLIDGVAINGVSGGPVFAQLKDSMPQILGTVSAYMPNRIGGDALPGLLRAQDVTTFHKTIQTIKSIDDARKTREEEEGINMISLGIYTTKDGKHYDCHFLSDEKMARAIGPLPSPGPEHVGARPVAFEVEAESAQEAKQKLAEAIGPGNW